jgi:hypothetical protein
MANIRSTPAFHIQTSIKLKDPDPVIDAIQDLTENISVSVTHTV